MTTGDERYDNGWVRRRCVCGHRGRVHITTPTSGYCLDCWEAGRDDVHQFEAAK